MHVDKHWCIAPYVTHYMGTPPGHNSMHCAFLKRNVTRGKSSKFFCVPRMGRSGRRWSDERCWSGTDRRPDSPRSASATQSCRSLQTCSNNDDICIGSLQAEINFFYFSIVTEMHVNRLNTSNGRLTKTDRLKCIWQDGKTLWQPLESV